MKRSTAFPTAAVLAACLLGAPIAHAAVVGQIDDFSDGTTQGWTVALLGAPHPAPPVNIATGGPSGTGDRYLQMTAVGGAGAGGRMSAINLSQWAGDYPGAGIGSIAMDLLNLGTQDLTIRLFLEDPTVGPPADAAVTSGVLLPAGGDWTTVQFALDPPALTLLMGDLDVLLGNVTALRIIHNPDPSFPPPAVVALLGVDNIRALPVSEPTTALLLAGACIPAVRIARRCARSLERA